jgi:hypothetical protein
VLKSGVIMLMGDNKCQPLPFQQPKSCRQKGITF